MAKNLKDLVKKNKKYLQEDVNLNELIDKFLQQEQSESANSRSSFFHPSMISKGIECQLWWWFFLSGAEGDVEALPSPIITAMAVGTAIHNEMQHILYRMGVLEGVWKCLYCGYEFWAVSPKGQCENCRQFFKSWDYLKFKEIPINYNFIKGHSDGIININSNRYLLEIKSIKNTNSKTAKYGFEAIKDAPLDEHYIQTQLYLYAWKEMAKQALVGEEIVVDNNGILSTRKLDDPVYIGARVIGRIDYGIINYVAKNSSQKRSFLVRRNSKSIKFLIDEMTLIWKAYLENTPEILSKAGQIFEYKCAKCEYRKICKG